LVFFGTQWSTALLLRKNSFVPKYARPLVRVHSRLTILAAPTNLYFGEAETL
jgi:hypothetical protein